MTSTLHMVQLDLDPKRLSILAKMLHLPPQTDIGYLAHCALGELFQQQAPNPFVVQSKHDHGVHVLGYSDVDHETLRAAAQAFASPQIYHILQECLSKPMPSTFGKGMHIGFELYACPVVRAQSETPQHRKGAEVDAFLTYCESQPDTQDNEHSRALAYTQWLQRQLERRQGAKLISAQVKSFQLIPMHRRDHNPKRKHTRLPRRPAVTFNGTLEITDPEAFQSLLASGIGRHSSFGFGMLLLRRATR